MRSEDNRPWVVIAGGGTAGHVLPALSVAKQLRAEGLASEAIHFVGSERGLEARLVPESKFSITLLPGRGIQRSLSVQNVTSLAALGLATAKAFALLARKRPAVILSVGGYASVPCALSAVILRIPLVLAESNARAGVAIRSVARFSKAVAVAFDGTGLPNTRLVGNPVRDEVLALSHRPHEAAKAEAIEQLGYTRGVPFVAIFGGSLGARRINEAVFNMCESWKDREVTIHHVIGERDFDSAQQWFATFKTNHPNVSLNYRQIRYEDRMDLVYAAADLVVCRAGATSIADLSVAGVPAILIPLPSAAEDHQSANADAVQRDGAAVHLPDREVSGERLAGEIDLLLGNPTKRDAMRAAQLHRARPNAAHDVAAMLKEFADRAVPSVRAVAAVDPSAMGDASSKVSG
jgi:UDP-N-acetylglucosamine--N-acetylmuramyl-(pentapeptide) pyrophosphoryl-undecaprenol N-acetylglucosamine transferase